MLVRDCIVLFIAVLAFYCFIEFLVQPLFQALNKGGGGTTEVGRSLKAAYLHNMSKNRIFCMPPHPHAQESA